MGKLYLVPTPIGNLEDITYRALKILKSVDLILVEDTRRSSKLLNHYEINKPTKKYHSFNEHKKLTSFISELKKETSIALITDAGTPSISDPGFLLVRESIKNEIEIECLPGATALIPALVQSGFPSERFVFEGFLPIKKGRKKRLEELKEEWRTIIIYESPHRIVRTLNDILMFFGNDRMMSISREMTKIYGETYRGSIKNALNHFQRELPKGEFVLCISGKSSK
tara:strand:- start:51 stop:728 length:678 start_codon:yes stop_codon:yes gene_type:complete